MAEASKVSDPGGKDPGGKVEVTVLEARNLAKLGRVAFDDTFRVELSLGDQVFTTVTKKRRNFWGSDVSWDQTFLFTFNGDMPSITLEVFGKTTRKKGFNPVGSVAMSYGEFSASGTPEIGVARPYNLPLSDMDGKASRSPESTMLRISIRFISLVVDEPADDLGPVLKQASDALDGLKGLNILGLSVGTELGRDAATRVANDAGSILSMIGRVAEIMDKLSEIHPYAKLAWDILDVSRKVIMAQVQEDASVRALFKRMKSLSERIETFMNKLDDFTAPDIHTDERAILRDVANTSRTCASFITKYSTESFAKRAMKRPFSEEAKDTIRNHNTTFESLEKRFNEKIWDGTSLIAHQILEKLMKDQIDVFRADSASLPASRHGPCFQGTQAAIRRKITDWISNVDEDVSRVLLLSGMAGTGKSTIAYTIANDCAEQGIFHTSFAFNRRSQPPPTARMLFPHIAAFLTAIYPTVKMALVKTQNKEIASGSNLERQLQELIIKPLKQPRPSAPRPVLIAVDAIDEADSDGVQAARVASLLATACDELPSNIRIFVTSRMETYVLEKMRPSAVQHVEMPDSSDLESLADVGLFIRDQLRDVKDMKEMHYKNLMTTSQGLFQWAATACNEIKAPIRGGSTPHQRYSMVVASGLKRDKKGLLDSLYKGVLERAYDPDKNPDGHGMLKTVIATLFVLIEPMTLDSFGRLLGEESDIEATLPDLASILDGISDRTRPVQPNHTSLRDFFLDPNRSESFCIKDLLQDAHSHATRTSFSSVRSFLRQATYNIDLARINWNGSSEYLASVADQVQQGILPDQQYACLHWAKHLAKAPTPEAAFWADMEVSFLADGLILLWIEVFCWLVIHRLRSAVEWTPPELSGCVALLAQIMMQQDSSCPADIQSDFEETVKHIDANYKNPPFRFQPLRILKRLRMIYVSSPQIVTLQRRAQDGSYKSVGNGFFVDLPGASHDVILTTAHNLVDAKGELHTDLVACVPKRFPRFHASSQFQSTSVQCQVPTGIYVCVGYLRQRQLETDWGAILLPHRTALGTGYRFNIIKPKSLYAASLHAHARASQIPVSSDWSGSAEDMHATGPPHSNSTASGTPIYSVSKFDNKITVHGICNPKYCGPDSNTALTSALLSELGSLVGVGGRNTRIRWLPPTLSTSNSEVSNESDDTLKVDNGQSRHGRLDWGRFYLYVNEEDWCLYLKRDSGSYFDIFLTSSYWTQLTLGFGSRMVKLLTENEEDNKRFVCAAASEFRGGGRLLIDMEEKLKMTAQARSEEWNNLYFEIDSTPITSPSHGELFKIILHREQHDMRGWCRPWQLHFALEKP